MGKRFDSCIRKVRKKIKNKKIKSTFKCDVKGKPNKKGRKRCKTNEFKICSKLR